MAICYHHISAMCDGNRMQRDGGIYSSGGGERGFWVVEWGAWCLVGCLIQIKKKTKKRQHLPVGEYL